MRRHYRSLLLVSLAAGILAEMSQPVFAASPTAAQALELAPIQRDVEYDRPDAETTAKSNISAEKMGQAVGWVVRGPSGEILRRFVDSNGDNKVDKWCYYLNGVEVYRDIDDDFNGKADQYRWLGTAGMKWGLDKNEDGKIDAWKAISAEEVTSELVAALASRDVDRFRRLLVNAIEVESMGLGDERQRELAERVQTASNEFDQLGTRQSVLGKDAKWVHFGGSYPGIVPEGTNGSTKDLIVYENVAAVYESGGKHGQLQIGSLVQIGNAWRLIGLPSGLIGSATAATTTGFFFQVPEAQPLADETPPEDAVSGEVQRLVAELDRVEQQLATATTPRDHILLNQQRTKALSELIQQSKTDSERAVWVRQLADSLSSVVQSGTFPQGMKQLTELHDQLDGKDELAAYVKFRHMLTEYTVSLRDADADFAKIQEKWLKDLDVYVEQYPGAPDAAEAMLQAAIAEEFAGNDESATKWYRRIAAEGDTSLLAKKAAGAEKRLNSVGKPVQLSGQTTSGSTVSLEQLRGRLVLVHYWATWCEPCKQDLQVLHELFSKYGRRGFALIGVNLDTNKRELENFLRQNRLSWPQMFEGGGLDGRLAVEMGIFNLPTMILVDPQGNMLSRNMHVSELEAELRKRIR